MKSSEGFEQLLHTDAFSLHDFQMTNFFNPSRKLAKVHATFLTIKIANMYKTFLNRKPNPQGLNPADQTDSMSRKVGK